MWTVDTHETLQSIARERALEIWDGAYQVGIILNLQTSFALNPAEASLLFDGTLTVPELLEGFGWCRKGMPKRIILPPILHEETL